MYKQGGGVIRRSVFILLVREVGDVRWVERLVMYDGYPYYMPGKFLGRGKKKLESPPPPHQLFQAWQSIHHAMLTPPPPPPLKKILCTPLNMVIKQHQYSHFCRYGNTFSNILWHIDIWWHGGMQDIQTHRVWLFQPWDWWSPHPRLTGRESHRSCHLLLAQPPVGGAQTNIRGWGKNRPPTW